MHVLCGHSLLDAGCNLRGTSAPCLHVGSSAGPSSAFVWNEKSGSNILSIGCFKSALDGSLHHRSRIRSSRNPTGSANKVFLQLTGYCQG